MISDDFEVGEENEMGVFRHTLTVLNRKTQSSHRARQEEHLRLKSIKFYFFFLLKMTDRFAT